MKPDLIWKCDLKESKINRNVLKKSNDLEIPLIATNETLTTNLSLTRLR